MVNKKGLWQMVEATVAIIIVAGAVFYTLSQQQHLSQKEDFYKLLRPLLNEIAKTYDLRVKILTDTNYLNDAEENIILFLSQRIQNPRLGYNVTICEASPPTSPCEDPAAYPSSAEEIYSEERLITAISPEPTSTLILPKIVKLYLWTK